MAFKENLLKKIKIDRLSSKVIHSLNPKGTIVKIDKNAMKELLDMVSYHTRNERFMDLYIKDTEIGKPEILVLDNELPIYKTTIEDVLLRKNPTLKEMISIKNAIKILNDSDVIISKKENTVNKIKKECIDILDLNYDENDIGSLKNEAVESLEKWDTENVITCIEMFSELLDYKKIPSFLKIDKMIVYGQQQETSEKKTLGPILIYDCTHNKIKFFNETFDNQDIQKINLINDIAIGKEKGHIEGSEVFDWLTKLVLKDMKPVRT